MKTPNTLRHELDEHAFPPFDGFPKEGISFLKKLKNNNNREWFAQHKSDYEQHLKFPMQCLIFSLQKHFADVAPEFDVHPKRSLFRIYRDTRFSNDKTPYKTHCAAHFVLKGTPKGLVGSGYYLQIAPGDVFLGGGIYMPDGEQLKSIRNAIAKNGKEFLTIINKPSFKKMFGPLKGTMLARPPKGFDSNHPMIELLKLKQFFVGTQMNEAVIYKKNFVTTITTQCKEMLPLVRFLNQAMGA